MFAIHEYYYAMTGACQRTKINIHLTYSQHKKNKQNIQVQNMYTTSDNKRLLNQISNSCTVQDDRHVTKTMLFKL